MHSAQLATTWVPYLCSAHFAQLLQEDLEEVALHSIGGLAVRVQDLSGQQFQKLLNLSEEREHKYSSSPAPRLASLLPMLQALVEPRTFHATGED
jgi:hypothetical protein